MQSEYYLSGGFMEKKNKWSIGVVFGTLLLVGLPAWADYTDGHNAYINEDFETAFLEWEPLAKMGDADAQNMLGLMYRSGQGVGQDFEKAEEWYRRSADQGNPSAQSNLGLVYWYGLGVSKDHQQAFHWFLRAAEQGNAAGQNHLGLMYFTGKGVAQDYVQSYKWAYLAANQGQDPAIQALSMLKKVMTLQQIEEAKALARNWSSKGTEEVL